MATIRDIAREAGVSVSTVSRVLTGRPDVSARTSERVRAVVDRHRFEANRNAQYLKQVDTSTIAVIVKGRSNVLFAAMLELVQAAVLDAGLRTAVRYIDEDADEVAEAERVVPQLKPRGVVLFGGDAEHFAAVGRRVGVEIPAVVLTNRATSPAHPLLSSVSTDDEASGRAAVAHLIARGHRAIGVVAGNPEASAISRHRLAGAQAGLAEAGLRLDGRVSIARYSLTAGFRATRELLDRAPEITALYAMSDLMALGAIRALADLGRRVPDDISVIGHDGVELGSFTVPRLTTIRQPQEEMVREGLRPLLDGTGRGVCVTLPVELVPGESVRDVSAN